MLASTSRTRHRTRWRGEITLSLIVSVGVVAFLSLVNAVFGQTAGGTGQGPRGILVVVPVALVAVFLGSRLASRMGLDRPGPATALNKAAIISLFFTALMTPAVLLVPSAGTALAGGALGAGAGIGGQLLNGLAAALLGQVAGLPLLFLGVLVLGYLEGSAEAERPRSTRRIPRSIYLVSALALMGVYGASGGVALASMGTGASASSDFNLNPCSTAPHDT